MKESLAKEQGRDQSPSESKAQVKNYTIPVGII